MTRVIANLSAWGLICSFALPALSVFSTAHSEEAGEKPQVKVVVKPENPALADNIRGHLSVAHEPCDSPRWLVEALVEQAPEEIDSAMRALGYYQGMSTQRLQFKEQCWQLSIDAQSGPATLFDKIDIRIEGDGAEHERFTTLPDRYPVKSGEQLDHGKYTTARNLMLSTALELGYLEAAFSTHELLVYPRRNTADAKLVLGLGPRYKIGTLQISDIYLNPALVKKLVNLPEGADYDANRVAESYRTLRASGYFSTIQVKPKLQSNPAHRIDIMTDLEMAKRHVWRLGAGFTTDTGERASISYENRWLNRRGDRVSGMLQLGEELSKFDAQYRILGSKPLQDFWTLGVEAVRERTDTVTSDRWRTGIAWNRRQGAFNYQARIDYLSEKSELGDTLIDSHFLIPAIRADWRQVDNDTLPTRGARAFIELQAAHDSIVSTTSFQRLHIGGKLLYPVGKGSLIGRIEAGAIATSGFEHLPSSLRFFAGGDESVRGYDYQSLGPVNLSGDVVGGKYLLTGTLEYQHPIHEDFAAALFVDAGNSFNDLDNMELKSSAGVGIRWKTPVGRLKVDVAIPSDRSKDDYRIHFGFGVEI